MEVLERRVGEVEGDVQRLYDRTRGIDERRLGAIERRQERFDEQREADRTELLGEVKDLRRTIIQAALAILGSMIAALVTLFIALNQAGGPV